MAKALFGHVGVGTDARDQAELRRLRDQVRALELEVAELRAANHALRATNAALSSSFHMDDEMLTLSVADQLAEREPALT